MRAGSSRTFTRVRGLSLSHEWNGLAAVGLRYFSGKNSSATASCSGTSGKKLSRWQ